MYFDMVLVLFYVRVTLFRFNNRLTEISMDALKNEKTTVSIDDWSKKFNALRWEFTLFTNLYQYPLISNQQQGLEMYELARKSLDLNELFKEIQEEIHNGQEFIQQQQQQQQNESLLDLQNQQKSQIDTMVNLQKEQERQSKASEEQTLITTLLTVVATIGLVFSIAVSIWSGYISESSAIKQELYNSDFRWSNRLWILLVTAFFSVLVIIFSKRISGLLNMLVNSIFSDRKKEENE